MNRPTGVAPRLAQALRPFVRGELPLRLVAWDGSSTGPRDGPEVVLRSPAALRRLLWHPGELGAAQAYVCGELDVPGDLDAGLAHVRRELTRRGVRSFRPSARQLAGLLRLGRDLGVLGRPLPAPPSQARLSGRRHTLVRDRAAVSHHYDLSNEFFALILDPHMAYSAAYFTRPPGSPGYDLADAQRDKLDLVARKVGLRPGDRVLDVGCGWGSFSLYAAEEFGAHVTGVTISAEQKEFVEARVAERGLAGHAEIRLQDYREVADSSAGPYDAVVSIEMGEHVGRRNYAAYAAALHANVRPGGRVLVQQMSRSGAYPGGGPFIESYIAPDMHMRPVGRTVAMIEEAGLEVRDVQAMREHYVHTVDAWYATFERVWPEVVDMVGEEIARVWRLYLVGGRQAFRDGRMGVDQILAVRPDAEGRSGVDLCRDDRWTVR